MLLGPVFSRELITAPRRPRHYLYRAVYVGVLLVILVTARLVMFGTQIIRNVGDVARFGGTLFQIIAPLQLAILAFLAALMAASAVSQEKDKRTLILLMLTRLNNSELVLGKLFASLLDVLSMLLAGAPILLLVTLFGGVTPDQVGRVLAVTLVTALAAGSLGSTFALWREKTFQTLSLTALTVMMWLALGEIVGAGLLFREWAGRDATWWAEAISPMRAILAAARPAAAEGATSLLDLVAFVAFATGIVVVLNLVAMWRVRVWNPSRDVQLKTDDQGPEASIWGAEHDLAKGDKSAAAEAARATHVDARRDQRPQTSRSVWDNPILWREVCTWAYGRKVLVVRLGYLLLFALAASGVQLGVSSVRAQPQSSEVGALMPEAAKPLAPFFLVSLVIVNALAVTSITNERDGQALDLLLVTDLSPGEIVFGKLWGVLYVTWPMVLMPLALAGWLWYAGGLTGENLAFVTVGLLLLDLFVAVLGIHCGMTYANSRTAIGVSLGTVFFLFLGITTCLMMMISFSGSFETQLAPFLVFTLGGSVGLYASLGSRNPSAAIGLAALLLPFLTLYAITSFSLHHYLTVFLVTMGVYGFTTAALLVPAVGEFDVAMGRTKGGAEE